MAFCNVTYPSFDAIPEFARNDFEQQTDGSWKMKQDAITGAAEHFNAGLAANRDRALQQLKDANTARDAANQRANAAESSLANITGNGGRIISKEDAEAFENYRKLGDWKTVQAKIEKADTTERELVSLKGEKGNKEFAEKAGLNFQPLNDWLSRPPAGVTYEPFTRDMEREVEEVQNGQTVKVKKTVPVAFLKKTVDNNGTKTQSEVELLTEAKSALPDYIYTALTAKSSGDQQGGAQDQNNNGGGGSTTAQPATNGVVLPMLGGGASNGAQPTGGVNNANLPPAQRFQAERDAAPNPFAPKK